MRVCNLSGVSFGNIYYGTKNEEYSKTQKDVIIDIEDCIENKGYTSRLKALGYDVYLEPSDDSYSIAVAFLKNARYDDKKELIFDKLVKIGKFVTDCSFKYKTIQYACSIEQFDRVLVHFFNKERFGKYKQYINYL